MAQLRPSGRRAALGDVLAIPLETPYAGGPENLILFVDVSMPEAPTILSQFAINEPDDLENLPGDRGPINVPGDEFNAGLVALTKLPSDNYLMLVTGGNNRFLLAYQSTSTDLKDPNLGWELFDVWSQDDDESALGGEEWPTGSGGHQTLNFVRMQNFDGDLDLFLIGLRNTAGGIPLMGQDIADLYMIARVGVSASAGASKMKGR